MRTVLRTLLIVVTCGFTLNLLATVAVVAGIDTIARPTSEMGMHDGVHWLVQVNPYFGSDKVEWLERNQNVGSTRVPPIDFLPTWLDVPPPTAAGFEGVMQRQRLFLASGFPFKWSWCELPSHTVMLDGSRTTEHSQGALALPLPAWSDNWQVRQPRVLPIRPIWGGLLANTLLYAIVAAVLIWIVRALRDRRRFRRGLCPRCTYERHGMYAEPCPECGWACVGRQASRAPGAA